MAQQNIDFGAFPNDPDADAIRAAFQKVQQNFTELYGDAATAGVTTLTAGQGLAQNRTTGDVTVTANISNISIQTSTLSIGLGANGGTSVTALNSLIPIVIDLAPTITVTTANATTVNATTVAATGNVSSNNFTASNLSTASRFVSTVATGTAPLTVTSTTQVANLNVAQSGIAGTVTTAAQPNITSVGTLTGLTVSGNAAANNVNATNGVVASTLTSNVATGTAPLIVTSTSRVSNLNVAYANVADFINANLVSTGTFYPLMANATSGNVSESANANLSFNAATGALSATQFTGTLTTAAQPNITSVGTLTGLTVGNATANTVFGNGTFSATGNANVGNIGATNGVFTNISGNGASLTGLNASNLASGTVPSARLSGSYSIAVTSATTAGTVTTAAQPNITSVGTLSALSVTGNVSAGNVNTVIVAATGNVSGANLSTTGKLSVSGNAVIGGNIEVNGNFIYANSATFNIADRVIEIGGNPNGSPLTSNDGKDRGELYHYYTTVPVDAYMGWDVSNAEFAFGSNVGITNDVITFNALGNVRASTFIGALSGTASLATYATTANSVAGANVSGAVAYATTANSVAGANVSGAVAYATTANSVAGANVSGAVAYATTANSVAGANVSGTVPSAASATVATTGNTVVTTLRSTGTYYIPFISATANANYALNSNANFSVNLANGFISATGFTGSAAGLTSIPGGNVTGPVANATYATSAGTAGTAGTVTTNAQSNITSVGTLTNLAIASGTKTSSAPVTLTQTWNNSSVVFTGITENITDTASDASSLLIDLQLGGVSKFKVSKFGDIVANSITANIAGDLVVPGANTQIIYNDNGNAGASSKLTFNFASNVLTVTGNLVASNANLGNATTSNYFIGRLYGDSNTASTAGTVTTNAQPNITSVGTLSSLGVNGTVTAVAFTANTGVFTGNGSSLHHIAGANVTGTVANATYAISAGSAGSATSASTATSATTAGTVTTNAQPNVTSVGTLTSLAVTGNISAGNVTAIHYGAGTGLTGIPGANVTGTVANATYAVSAGSATSATTAASATIAGTVTSNAQSNITSVGTLLSLTSSGNIVGANLTTTSYVIHSVATSISAAGTTQGTATALSKEINVVSTVAAGAGVVLPTAIAGMIISVTNTNGNALLVYPSSGTQINSLGTNVAFSQGATTIQFIAPTTTQWYTVGATYA
jgi:hypothetical protein